MGISKALKIPKHLSEFTVVDWVRKYVSLCYVD